MIFVGIQPKLFYADRTDDALKNCRQLGHRPLFMPEVIDERIRAPNNSFLWTNWLSATSIRATGTTTSGTPVVLYVHTGNSFIEPATITARMNKLTINGAGAISIEEFRRLLKLGENGETDKAGNRLVHIVDYNTLKPSTNELMPLSGALEHLETIPFIGSEERAKRYFARFKEVYCKDEIRIERYDDLNGDQPLGRFLFVGFDYHGIGLGCFGCVGLNRAGRFVGIPTENRTNQLEL